MPTGSSSVCIQTRTRTRWSSWNIADLEGLLEKLSGLCMARFHEPDLDDLLTAICVESAAKKRLSGLRLAA